MQGIVPVLNSLGFTAALGAYRDGDAWLNAIFYYLRGNKDLVIAKINAASGLAAMHVEAAYFP
jgi:cystathionine beta-lyase